MHQSAPYLPHLKDLAAVAITYAIGAVMLVAGGAVAGRREPAEFRIAAGWGALCVVLTIWGVFVPLSLRIPAILFVCAVVAWHLWRRRGLFSAGDIGLGRLLAVSLPLWLIMAPIHPSQPDTFLNLLPNAMYLVDYGRLPAAALPPSHSFLPAAPYNTQFLAFLGGLIVDDYPGPGMSLINVMLQLVAGLAIARALAAKAEPESEAPSWGLTALGLLLATLLNPGFVPRLHFSSYGETALAVTALLAAWIFVRRQGELAQQRPASGLLALSLTLAAAVNAKQSGPGLVTALAGAAVIAGWCERAVPWIRLLRAVTLAVLPAVLLYAVWRYYVHYAGVAELTMLPWTEWNWSTIPATLASAAGVIAEKPVYYGCALAALLALPHQLRRDGWTPTTRLLAFHAAAFGLYNVFLLLTYIGHFPGEMSTDAHSYFRYSTHLTLVLVLSLALFVRDLGVGRWAMQHRRRLSAAAVAAALAVPVGFAERLRFDLVMPQPLVWRLADEVKPLVHDGERLALLLPGDNGSVATMLSGVLADAPPRRRLHLLTRDKADPPTLAAVARLGYRRALVSCTPAGTAALLEYQDERWREVATWPYPADPSHSRWQAILSPEPLCRRS